MSNPVQDDLSVDIAALQAEFETLYIPPNLDSRLLTLWIEREKASIERSRRKPVQPPLPRETGRSLTRLFPAYIGISVMCCSVILGVIQFQETTVILQTACIIFLIYTLIGLFTGIIAERCVNDSVETLLQDVIERSREAGKQIETIERR